MAKEDADAVASCWWHGACSVRSVFIDQLGIADDPFKIFLFLTISGYGFYFLLASLSYLVRFKWLRRRCNPDYVPDWGENRRALRVAFASVAGNAVLTAPIHMLIAHGYGRVYFEVGEYGWAYLGLSVLAVLVVTETLVYWAHRALHTRTLYRLLHRHHHQFRRPTPYVAVAFHPLDSFLQALPHHLCAFLFPLHIGVYTLSLALVLLWAVSIHDRWTFVRWGFINYSDHHLIHHWYNRHNLGQYTTVWDRLCGTYRSPRPGDGWWPPARAGAGER